MSQDFDQSFTQNFGQSPCQNRNIATPSPPFVTGKILFFIKNTTLANIDADTTSLIAFLNANTADAMFNLNWNPFNDGPDETIYLYDAGANPVWNFSAGGFVQEVPFDNVTFQPPQGSSGYGLSTNLGFIQPGNPGTTAITVCAWVTWNLYVGVTSPISKIINRITYSSGIGLGSPSVSASMVAAWYNGPGAGTFQNPPFPPTTQFLENLETIDCPPDSAGTHIGQVLKPPTPTVLGIQTIATPPPIAPYNLFGEFFNSN